MRAQEHPAYATVRAAFPAVKIDGGGLTTAQGRLCFHQERLLFGRRDVAAFYRRVCRNMGLPDAIGGMSDGQCKDALRALECVAAMFPVIGRPSATGWENL